MIIFKIFFFLDNMVERGSQSGVGTRSIRVETSGGFYFEEDLDKGRMEFK